MSEVQFCTTECPQLFEFGVATCRTFRLRSKKAVLEVATSNLQNCRGFAKTLHVDLIPPKLSVQCTIKDASEPQTSLIPPSNRHIDGGLCVQGQ